MQKSDLTRRPPRPDPNQAKNEAREYNRDRQHYDQFRETLATPIPNRSYRSQIDLIDSQPSSLEKLVRYVAVVLSALVAIRLVFGLFTTSRANPVVDLVYNLTDWIVRPFQAIFGLPPTGSGGYVDWPAVAAIIVIALIAALFVSLIRPRPGAE